MVDRNDPARRALKRKVLICAAGLVSLGAAAGAGAVSLTRPSVEMAPVVPIPIAKIDSADGIVTVRGP